MPTTAVVSAPSLLPYKKRKDSTAGIESNESRDIADSTGNHEAGNSSVASDKTPIQPTEIIADKTPIQPTESTDSAQSTNIEKNSAPNSEEEQSKANRMKLRSDTIVSEGIQLKDTRTQNDHVLAKETNISQQLFNESCTDDNSTIIRNKEISIHNGSRKDGDLRSGRSNTNDSLLTSTEQIFDLDEKKGHLGELRTEVNSEVDLNVVRGELKKSFNYGEKKNQRLKVHFTCNPSEQCESDRSATASMDSLTEAFLHESIGLSGLSRTEPKKDCNDVTTLRGTVQSIMDQPAYDALDGTKIDSLDIVEIRAVDGKTMLPASEIRACKSSISERRLPSKKRKGSHDMSAQPPIDANKPLQRRKGSHDSSTTDITSAQNELTSTCLSNDDIQSKERKGSQGSQDILISFEDTATGRLRADSTGSMLFDLILAPRKYSQETNSSGISPFAIDPPDTTGIKIQVNLKNDEKSTGSLESISQHHTSHLDISSLEQLDEMKNKSMLLSSRSFEKVKETGVEKSVESEDHSASNETFSSSGHRVLLEAIMLSTESACSPPGTEEEAAPVIEYPIPFSSTLQSQFSGAAFARRDRLESWGGMSDISIPWHSSSIHESPAGEPVMFLDEKPGALALSGGRARLNSLASLSEASFGYGSLVPLPALAQQQNLDGAVVEINNGSDIHDFVAAAMASIGDQLAELAGAVESAANGGDSFAENFRGEFDFDDTSNSDISQPLIGAFSDGLPPRKHSRVRSWSVSSEKLSVDYDAVQAAMEAAEAASSSLGLTDVKPQKKFAVPRSNARAARRKLPLKRNLETESSSSSSICSEPDLALIRERARAAAGIVVPPKIPSSTPSSLVAKAVSAPKKAKKKPLPPMKKRAKKNSLSPSPSAHFAPWISDAAASATPKAAKKKSPKKKEIVVDEDVPMAPQSSSAATKQQAKQQGQSNQKWESMFDALVEFIQKRRLEDIEHLSDKEKEEWIWDGNVATNYKSHDGKALGRWVNNQRSAKSKGALKEDREQRLIDVGLKWSVLASNAWNLMLDELNTYITEQKQSGVTWDGNVPTNYQIKTSLDSDFAGEGTCIALKCEVSREYETCKRALCDLMEPRPARNGTWFLVMFTW